MTTALQQSDQRATASATAVEAPSVQQPHETLRDVAIRKIMATTGCQQPRAERAFEYIARLLNKARQASNGVYILSKSDMKGNNLKSYKTMDRIMPHGTTPKPGSTAEAVQAALIDPTLGEVGIMHFLSHNGDLCAFRQVFRVER